MEIIFVAAGRAFLISLFNLYYAPGNSKLNECSY